MGWVVITKPRPLYHREKPGTHCIGGWVGPRAGLDGCRKSRPQRYSIPGLLKLATYIQGVPGGMCQTSGECSLS